MKTKVLLLAFLAIIPAFHTLYADALARGFSISVTGDIIQDTSTNSSPFSTSATIIEPITIKNVLSVLGITGTAKDLAYYLDLTANSLVIAPKSYGATTGTGTPVATVVAFGTSTVSWNPTNDSSIIGATETGLNGNLTGTVLINEVHPHNIKLTSTGKFQVFGTVSGLQTIMKGTYVEIRPYQ